MYVAIILLAGFFEMWAAGTICNNSGNSIHDSCVDELAWAVACGAISTLICIIMTVLFCAAKGIAQQATPFVAGFLFLLWLCGVIWCTFSAPFTSACGGSHGAGNANGYFGTWIAFIASAMYLKEAIPQVKAFVDSNMAGKALLFPIFVFSVVEFAQASNWCANATRGWYSRNTCGAGLGWAIACGVISAFVALLLMFVKQLEQFAKYFYIFLTMLWFCAVATLTYTYRDNSNGNLGIFANANNGFFSIWICFFCSFILCYQAWMGAVPDAAAASKDPKMFIAIIMAASFFEMWAAATLCHAMSGTYNGKSHTCQDEYAWSLAVGVISLFICIVITIMGCTCPNPLVDKICSILLFLLWISGVGVCTFNAPFTSACSNYGWSWAGAGSWGYGTGNGYFACWIAFIASCMYLYAIWHEVAAATGQAMQAAGNMIAPLFVASVVVMAQASWECDHGYYYGSSCTDVEAWAVALSVISAFCCILLLIPQVTSAAGGVVTKIIVALLALAWFCGIATLTYTYQNHNGHNNGLGIFAKAGNGFFGTWVAFFISFVLCYTTFLGGGTGAGGLPTGGHASNMAPQPKV